MILKKKPYEKAIEHRKTKEVKKVERDKKLELAFSTLEFLGHTTITISDLADEMGGVSKQTVLNYIKDNDSFETVKGDGKSCLVVRK